TSLIRIHGIRFKSKFTRTTIARDLLAIVHYALLADKGIGGLSPKEEQAVMKFSGNRGQTEFAAGGNAAGGRNRLPPGHQRRGGGGKRCAAARCARKPLRRLQHQRTDGPPAFVI